MIADIDREGKTPRGWLRDPRVRWCALGVVAAIYVVAHVAAVFTENINWDEFALLWRAEKAVRTGVVDGGGRPGLAVLALYGFVDGCTDTSRMVSSARVVWSFCTFGVLAGVFVLVWRATRDSSHRWLAAALATASIALVPVFMRWSLQIRTDQPAVAAALWAGVALLATKRREPWAVVAGALVGVGYLFSQKAIYVAGLVGIVAIADAWAHGSLAWRDLRRVAFAGIGAIAIIGLYAVLVRTVFTSPRGGVSVGAGFDLFAWYRQIVGYRVYAGMAKTLVPLVLLVGLVLLALARASRLRDRHLRSSIAAGIVLVAGTAVAWFHAAAFPYFWITLGLFPAIAIGLAWPAARTYFPRMSLVVAGLAVALFAWRAIPYRLETLHDTRAVQNESMGFVDGLSPAWRGFHPDGGLVCRRDPSPFPMYLRENVARTFGGPNAGANTTAFVAEFRARPVAYIVRTHRLESFPLEVRTFWVEHYVPYRGAVELAGQRVHASGEGTRTIDIVIAGTYRWVSTSAVTVDDRPLAAGTSIALSTGSHVARWSTAIDGVLVLAVDAAMQPSSEPYYHPVPLMEITGMRRRW